MKGIGQTGNVCAENFLDDDFDIVVGAHFFMNVLHRLLNDLLSKRDF